MGFWKVGGLRGGGDPSKSGAPLTCHVVSPCRPVTSRARWARWEAPAELWVSDRGAAPARSGFLPPPDPHPAAESQLNSS